MEKSAIEMKMSEREALTNYRARRKGKVRKWKESERVRGTHSLSSAENPGQKKDRKRARKHSLPVERGTRKTLGHGSNVSEQEYSLPVERRGRDNSGQGKSASERAMGTHLLSGTERGRIRTRNGSNRASGTHELSAHRGGGHIRTQYERKQTSGTHELSTTEGVANSGQRKNAMSERGVLTSYTSRKGGQVGTK
jgi:hypothetical protein